VIGATHRAPRARVAGSTRAPAALPVAPRAVYPERMRRLPALLLTIATVVLLAAEARAHAVLKKSSLPKRVPPDTAQAVVLSFNSAVEPTLSRVVLVDAKGAEREIPLRAGAARNEIALDLPPLSAGPFGLRYKVLAVDGHVTENLLRFSVAAGD